MHVAALQMVSTPDVDRNLASAGRLIAQAADQGARLVALPEYFCLLGRRDRDKLEIAETDGDGPIQHFLATAARRHAITVIGGTLPIRTADPERDHLPLGVARRPAAGILVGTGLGQRQLQRDLGQLGHR